jgi:Peptidase family M1 domain
MRALLGLLVAVFAGFPFAQTGETDGILTQLSKIRLDKKQIYNIRDLTIRRDSASISFHRGTIAFVDPVGGRVTGAVFIGSGEILAIPPDAVEKQQVNRFTNAPVLDEPFSGAFFRFTDDTYDEIVKAYQEHAHEDVTPDDASQFLPWDRILADRSDVLNYRILADYLGTSKPLFFGELYSERRGWFDIIYDQRMTEELAFMKVHEDATSVNIDVWSSFNRRAEARDLVAAAKENKLPLDVVSYDIEATVNPSMQLEASTVLHARARNDGERVISLDLSRFLRVSAVTMGTGQTVPFFQHVDMTAEEIRRTGINTVVVVLPEPTRAGQDVTLKFTYTGDVIEKRGSGIFYVGERGLWYPNSGTEDPATFNLTFHFPSKYSLVATGKRMKEWEDSGLRHSTWVSEREFPVAGFNLGDFTSISDSSGPIPISVSVYNDVETIYQEVAEQRAVQKQLAIRAAAAALGRRGQPLSDNPSVAADPDLFSTRDLAESVLEGVKDTVSFFVEEFGPFPYSHLTVSQFPVNYSQGWPTLLYVSTLSFFTAEQRQKLGLSSESDFMFTELVRAHEVAHQWFGNKVGWNTYHDQWISEAFSNYAGAMYIEHKYQDGTRLKAILDEGRRRLLEHAPDGTVVDELGPIWLGQRLSTSAAPNGYAEITYWKGPWILHMLRMMMGDDAFRSMARDFLDSFDGKLASTWDLKSVAEKHMTKSMDPRGDGKLDWFFDEWVRGTGIPTYSINSRIQPSPKGGFIVEGRVTQSGVPDDFMMPVPVYGDDQLMGRVLVSQEDGSFHFETKIRPERILLDPYQTILSTPRN